MPLDGIFVSSIAREIKDKALGLKIEKIYQPEKDEVLLTLRGGIRLLLSASPQHPRICFTDEVKKNPDTPPIFCMVLRKHILNGKIVDVTQPGFERIITLHVESLNEMGDMAVFRLIIEIMGKHSNIMLVRDNGIIMDAAKRITFETSSVREVLPGKPYEEPRNQGKISPRDITFAEFTALMEGQSTLKAGEALFKTLTGISPFLAEEICSRANADTSVPFAASSDDAKARVYESFQSIINDALTGRFRYQVVLDGNGNPVEFSCTEITMAKGTIEEFDSPSHLLEYYYKNRDLSARMTQKTAALRKLVKQNIERCVKKEDMFVKSLKSVEGRETKRLYGELITANIHAIKPGDKILTAVNYYDENGATVDIPLDETLTPAGNLNRYYGRYNKEKRAFAALNEQREENAQELKYLETVLLSINDCLSQEDVAEIRAELAEGGFVKRAPMKKGAKVKKTKPLHFVTEDGFHLYVGKNNRQNDELTIRFATNYDIWLHTKDIPGSHVILKTDGQSPSPAALTVAASIAAYYSKGREGSIVAVDYAPRKNVKKPSGAKPGMVIYEGYKTAFVAPSTMGLEPLND